MGGQRGFVVAAIDTQLFEGDGVGVGGTGTAFATAETAKHDFDLLLKRGHVSDVRGTDAATAEDPDMGELIKMCQCDLPGHSASH